MLFLVLFGSLLLFGIVRCDDDDLKPNKLSLTLSAKLNALELSWNDIESFSDGHIILTDEEPQPPYRIHSIDSIQKKFTYGPNNNDVLYWIQPVNQTGWQTTNIIFDKNLLSAINVNTTCYGYWAIYLDKNYEPVEHTCIRAYATWMNDHRNVIEQFKFRDLFIVGTHDSGSYRMNFNASNNETVVTKYSLTQTDDITIQLMHGVRYLDLRIGFYRSMNPQFWINHGISRQQPLQDVIGRVKAFVEQTNEIVIFDIQEFPVGFGRGLDVHHRLAMYLNEEFKDFYVNPNLGWEAKLSQIWDSKRNIIVSYDHYGVVQAYPHFLFQNVHHRWGDVQRLSDLRRYLSPNSSSYPHHIIRPFSDMAQITPTTWDVITDRYNGLRSVADSWNRQISNWYRDEWGMSANIVSADFYRGTTLMETAIYYNFKKNKLRRMRRKRSLRFFFKINK